MSYDYIDDKITREVLAQISIDEDSICHALFFATKCLHADLHNEDVAYKIYDLRCAALNDAQECWNDLGDTIGTIDCLRNFWSI